jgi:putative endonuclease
LSISIFDTYRKYSPVAQWQTCLPAGRAGSCYSECMYFVYVIQSKLNGYLYKGISRNVQIRLKEHNQGKNQSTKNWRPWELIYSEFFYTRIEARKREKFFKTGEGREFLKQVLTSQDIPR